MKLNVKVQPRSSRNKVVKVSDGEFKVYVTSAPESGKANDAVIELLAEHLSIKKKSIRIILGQTSRNKVIELEE